MKKTKKKLLTLNIFKNLILFAPIFTVIGLNANKYFTQEQGFLLPQGYELTLGGMFTVLIAASYMAGKTNILKGSKVWWIGLMLFVFLDAIIDDGILILGTLAISNTVANLFTNPINDLKIQLGYEKQATASASANKVVYQEMVSTNAVERSGRV